MRSMWYQPSPSQPSVTSVAIFAIAFAVRADAVPGCPLPNASYHWPAGTSAAPTIQDKPNKFSKPSRLEQSEHFEWNAHSIPICSARNYTHCDVS